jgi:hypothetical protein
MIGFKTSNTLYKSFFNFYISFINPTIFIRIVISSILALLSFFIFIVLPNHNNTE